MKVEEEEKYSETKLFGHLQGILKSLDFILRAVQINWQETKERSKEKSENNSDFNDLSLSVDTWRLYWRGAKRAA